MLINKKLYNIFIEKAAASKIKNVTLGLGYTAVQTADGGLGLSYTYFKNKITCSGFDEYTDFEKQPAVKLLAKIKSENPLERSIALALINALNYDRAVVLPEDQTNSILLEKMNITKASRAAMVGHIKPLERKMLQRKARVEVIDHFNEIGSDKSFFHFLRNEADVLLLTSTTLLNNSTEKILSRAGKNICAAMLGPGTPMVPEAFDHLPLVMLCGTVPDEQDNVLKTVRHGFGTRFIHKYSRKVFLNCSNDEIK